MKTRSFLAVGVLLALALGVFFSPIAAQDMYDGRFTFSVPAGFEVNESATLDLVRVEDGDTVFVVVGPNALAAIIGDREFLTEPPELEEGAEEPEEEFVPEDDPAARLAYYLDRSGYTLTGAAGFPSTVANGIITSTGVSLERRGQLGSGALIDVGNGREMVLIALSPTGAPRSTSVIVDSLDYPADIVDVASAAGTFDSLLAAVSAAGLEDALRGGELTVFAPTDAAFAAALEALGFASLDELVEADLDLLTAVLQYHVVDGVISVPDRGVGTLNGADLPLATTVADGVNIVTSNIEAYNGVIHVIDTVLLPPPAEEE